MRAEAERQQLGEEYATRKPIGSVDIWPIPEGGFHWSVSEGYWEERQQKTRTAVSATPCADMDDLLRTLFNVAGCTGVAWNYDALLAARAWPNMPPGHVGQIGSDLLRIFDLRWVA